MKAILDDRMRIARLALKPQPRDSFNGVANDGEQQNRCGNPDR
jgi:hypothetical protein